MTVPKSSTTCGMSAGAALSGRTCFGGGRSRFCGPLKAILSATCLGSLAHAETAPVVDLDAGPVFFVESLVEGSEEASVLRVRFLMPALKDPKLDYGALADSLKLLCDQVALPLVNPEGPPSQIVVSLASAPIAHGETNSDVRQVFEAFRADFTSDSAVCIWGDL